MLIKSFFAPESFSVGIAKKSLQRDMHKDMVSHAKTTITLFAAAAPFVG